MSVSILSLRNVRNLMWHEHNCMCMHASRVSIQQIWPPEGYECASLWPNFMSNNKIFMGEENMIFLCAWFMLSESVSDCTLVRSWYLRGCWGTVLAVTRETDGILWSNRAALGPLSPARPWAAGTREPVWVSLDWKSCCSNTLSLAVGHKQREKERKCG